MDLVALLATLTADEGLAVALVGGRDGLLIEGQVRGAAIDLHALAARAAQAVLDMERLGRTVGSGALAQIRLRFDDYVVLIEALSPADVLVAGIEGMAGSERLLDTIARYRRQLQEALDNL